MMFFMNKYLYFSILLLFYLPNYLFSQTKTESNVVFSTEPAIYTLKKEHVNISLENGNPLIESKIEFEKLLQVDKGDYWSNEFIFYSSFLDLSDIKAEMLIPYKKNYKSISPSNILVKENYGESSFYDDGKMKELIFPKSPKNSIIKVSYTEKYTLPYLYGIYFFSTYIPVVKSEYSVSFPDDVQLGYKLFNAEKDNIRFTETKKKNIITYTWVAENIKSYSRTYNDYKDFSISYYEPHLLLSIKSIKNNNFLSDYKDLYKSYMILIKNPYPEIDPGFKTIVDSICKDRNTEIETLEAIYYFVQSKIKYIAIEDGFAGFVPENPLLVFNRRYGDCKGKSNLLVTLLRQANIKAWLTWVGTRYKPYKYTEFPSPYNDNHMIVTAQINGKDYFLDATSGFLHYTYPSAFIQGKESLIGLDSNECRIAEIPVVPYDKNIFSDNLTINIKNDTLYGSGRALLTGYYKNDLTIELIRSNDLRNTNTFKRWFCKMQNKAKLDTAYTTNLESRIDTLKVDYKFSLPGYIRKNDDHIYINLNIEKNYQNKNIDTANMIYNKYYDYAFLEKLNYKLILPEGYIVESIPNDCNSIFDNFGFKISYKKFADYIIMEEEIYVKKPYIDLQDFPKWNQLIKDVNKAYNQTISLKQNDNENKK
jgi:transglutaminase-like putative cysteine protease